MYYQLFLHSTPKGQKYQISCDSMEEVQNELIRMNYPRFVDVHYYNENGLVGIGYKMFSTLKETYLLIKKVKA